MYCVAIAVSQSMHSVFSTSVRLGTQSRVGGLIADSPHEHTQNISKPNFWNLIEKVDRTWPRK